MRRLREEDDRNSSYCCSMERTLSCSCQSRPVFKLVLYGAQENKLQVLNCTHKACSLPEQSELHKVRSGGCDSVMHKSSRYSDLGCCRACQCPSGPS